MAISRPRVVLCGAAATAVLGEYVLVAELLSIEREVKHSVHVGQLLMLCELACELSLSSPEDDTFTTRSGSVVWKRGSTSLAFPFTFPRIRFTFRGGGLEANWIIVLRGSNFTHRELHLRCWEETSLRKFFQGSGSSRKQIQALVRRGA